MAASAGNEPSIGKDIAHTPKNCRNERRENETGVDGSCIDATAFTARHRTRTFIRSPVRDVEHGQITNATLAGRILKTSAKCQVVLYEVARNCSWLRYYVFLSPPDIGDLPTINERTISVVIKKIFSKSACLAIACREYLRERLTPQWTRYKSDHTQPNTANTVVLET